MTEATTSQFYDALKGLSHSGYSCNGVNLFGDKASIAAAANAFHYGAQKDQFQTMLVEERATTKELKALLKEFHDDAVRMSKHAPREQSPEMRARYERVCLALGIAALPPGASFPVPATPKIYEVHPSSDTVNCRRITNKRTGQQLCKVYANSPIDAQLKAEAIVAALEVGNVSV